MNSCKSRKNKLNIIKKKKKSCFEAAVVRAPVFGPICADHYVHLLPLFYSHFAARE